MKNNRIIIGSLFFGCMGLALLSADLNPREKKPAQLLVKSTTIGCAPAMDEVFSGYGGKLVTILPGWGSYSYRISTNSDSAQIYFNQGLTMYYSYHFREAVFSFREAARFDSTCAMLYWAQALAMGPDYNYGYNYKMRAGVPGALQLMNRYKDQATEKEKDLIGVMNRRYIVEDTADLQRKQLNVNYAEAMRSLIAKYPGDIDIKALYTDAVMLLHSWDFWSSDGTPRSWTRELVQLCESILEKAPHHPAALHYYIHVTEASRKPEVALSSADSLLKLFPGIAHMVHMSSHEYERIGHYARGVKANEAADRSLGQYAALASGLNLTVHVEHYYAVDAYCALSGGMYQNAMEKTMALRDLIDINNMDTYRQYLYMFPLLAMVRMGKWQEIIDDSSIIDAGWTYALLLNDFAKGMAYAKRKDFEQAQQHLDHLRKMQADSLLRIRFSPPKSSPYEAAIVAENILAANIAFEQHRYASAFSALGKAAMAEDNIIYSEPNLWMLPARQYQGAFLLKLNKPKQAEKVYREDLLRNPGNGWSLVGLYQSLKAQQKTQELKKIKALFMHSFSEADVVPGNSAY